MKRSSILILVFAILGFTAFACNDHPLTPIPADGQDDSNQSPAIPIFSAPAAVCLPPCVCFCPLDKPDLGPAPADAETPPVVDVSLPAPADSGQPVPVADAGTPAPADLGLAPAPTDSGSPQPVVDAGTIPPGPRPNQASSQRTRADANANLVVTICGPAAGEVHYWVAGCNKAWGRTCDLFWNIAADLDSKPGCAVGIIPPTYNVVAPVTQMQQACTDINCWVYIGMDVCSGDLVQIDGGWWLDLRDPAGPPAP